MFNIISNTPLDEMIVCLAILIAIFFVMYKIYRILKYLVHLKQNKASEHTQTQKADILHKKEALAKFKEVHTHARDNLKKIAKEIASHPNKTTEALRRMMKRKP